MENFKGVSLDIKNDCCPKGVLHFTSICGMLMTSNCMFLGRVKLVYVSLANNLNVTKLFFIYYY